MTLAIVKAGEYQLTEGERAQCVQHLSKGYNPNVTYRQLWPHGAAPLTFGDFLNQYADVIIAATSLTADRWRVGLSAELAQRRRDLDQTARELRAALATLAEAPAPEGEEREAQQERQCGVVAHFGKGFQIAAALVQITKELRSIRTQQLDDAAALVSMLASSAQAKNVP